MSPYPLSATESDLRTLCHSPKSHDLIPRAVVRSHSGAALNLSYKVDNLPSY